MRRNQGCASSKGTSLARGITHTGFTGLKCPRNRCGTKAFLGFVTSTRKGGNTISNSTTSPPSHLPTSPPSPRHHLVITPHHPTSPHHHPINLYQLSPRQPIVTLSPYHPTSPDHLSSPFHHPKLPHITPHHPTSPRHHPVIIPSSPHITPTSPLTPPYTFVGVICTFLHKRNFEIS